MDFVLEITCVSGKYIMDTNFIRWLNEKFPKDNIIVVSAHQDLFEYNPRVHRNLRLDQPYLFEDYIKGRDFRRGEPYACYEYYREKDKKHLMNLFPKAYGFEELNDKPETEVYLTKGEEMDGKMFCMQNNPLITIQAFGGLPNGAAANRGKIDSSQRDLPFKLACKITNILIQKGFKILQIRGKTEPIIPGVLQIELPFRNLLPILKHSKGHIGIDSSGMHAAAIFKKPQLIFWGGTHKDNLGYIYEGFIDVISERAMHGRPVLQVHDRAGLFPYKNKNDGLEFEYSEKYLNEQIDKFIGVIKNEK